MMLLVALPLLLSAGVAAAQSAIVRGRVVDELRTGIGSARVSLDGLGASALTDSVGQFRITGLPPGAFVARVFGQGYSPIERRIDLVAADSVTLDVVLLRQRTDWVQLTTIATPLPADSVVLPAPDSAIVRQRQVGVVLRSPPVGQVLTLDVFEELTLRLVAEEVRPYRAGGFTVAGPLWSPSGQLRGSGTLVVSEGRLRANLRIGSRLYVIRPLRREIHLLTEIAIARLGPFEFPAIDTIPLPPRPPIPRPDPFRPSRRPFRWWLQFLDVFPFNWPAPTPTGPPPELACTDLPTLGVGRRPQVRLLLAFTKEAQTGASSSTNGELPDEIGALIELAVQEAAMVLRESGVQVDLELVHSEPTDLLDDGTHGSQALARLLLTSTPGDEVERLHRLRDAHAADVVGVVAENAYGGYAHRMLSPNREFQDSAFLALDRVSMGTGLVLAHELGHTFGGAHLRDPVVPMTDPPRFSYAYPFACKACAGSPGGEPGWVTLMGSPIYGELGLIPMLSSSTRTWNSLPTGLPAGTAEPADNALGFAQAVSSVASFRLTSAWFSSTAAAAPWSERRAASERLDEIVLGDFDGDRLLDGLRPDVTSGLWSWARSLLGEWVERNPADATRAVPASALRAGRFSDPAYDDVFWFDPAENGWRISKGAASPWSAIEALESGLTLSLDDLAFADLDGDGLDDVFRADASTGRWWFASAGRLPWVELGVAHASKMIKTADLRFGDFDGDGRADVFRSDASSGTWWYVIDGNGDWVKLNGASSELKIATASLVVGDFTGDGIADVFSADGTNWTVSDGGRAPLALRMTSCFRTTDLWFRDVDGDGVLDALRGGTRP